jgi:hypothetical protein
VARFEWHASVSSASSSTTVSLTFVPPIRPSTPSSAWSSTTRIERARAIAAGGDAFAAGARLVAALDRLEGRDRDAGIELLMALERLVTGR